MLWHSLCLFVSEHVNEKVMRRLITILIAAAMTLTLLILKAMPM